MFKFGSEILNIIGCFPAISKNSGQLGAGKTLTMQNPISLLDKIVSRERFNGRSYQRDRM